MQDPLVSVIIPAYNSEKFIAETIESALIQSFTDLEVLVVDDGSIDYQKQVIDQFVLKDNRVRYIFQNNQGVSAARNNGYAQSRGQYIAFLDSDDVWFPENLKLKLEKFLTGDFGLVHSDAVLINERSEIIPGSLSGNEGDLLNDLLSWNGTQIPGPSSVLIKRRVIDQVGLFDVKVSTSADRDYFIRVASRFKIGRVDQVTWKYRVHNSNMHKNISVMENDAIYVFRKARTLNLFHTKSFERKCRSITYLVLAASWAGDGKNKKRALTFIFRAIWSNPSSIGDVIKKLIIRWL